MENNSNEYIGYVGTTSINGSKGVYQISVSSETGKGQILECAPVYNSGALALSGDKKVLYALSEGMTFHGAGKGGITVFQTEKGKLEEKNWAISDGQRPCFAALNEKRNEIYIANFYGGTISVFEVWANGEIGKKKKTIKHKKLGPFGPGVHCVAIAPDGRYFFSLELSGDLLYLYDAENDYAIVESIAFPERSGPRHIAISEDGKTIYVNRQGDEKVSVIQFHPEEVKKLELVQEVSSRTEDMKTRTEPAGIQICPGKRLLAVSNRGVGSKNREDSISLFRIVEDTEQLESIKVVRTGGQMPRDFSFTPDGKLLLVGYQFQGYLDSYRVTEDGSDLEYLGRTLEIPSPVCIAF